MVIRYKTAEQVIDRVNHDLGEYFHVSLSDEEANLIRANLVSVKPVYYYRFAVAIIYAFTYRQGQAKGREKAIKYERSLLEIIEAISKTQLFSWNFFHTAPAIKDWFIRAKKIQEELVEVFSLAGILNTMKEHRAEPYHHVVAEINARLRSKKFKS